MSYKSRDGKTHQSTILISDSGLPLDGIATISGSYRFIEGTSSLAYGGGTVTLPVGSDLTPVTVAKARYTGKYVLITKEGSIYYIDRQSINIAARTFVISLNDKTQSNPPTIDTSAGWVVAEADIVNRLATTSAAKIDNIEFRDMHFQMQLDGDPVSVVGPVGGNAIEPNDDGSINTVNTASAVSTPTILNTNMAISGNVYTVDIPATARRFQISSRLPAKLEVSYSAPPTSYITIKPGNTYEVEGLYLSSLITIHIKSNKDNTVIETVYWE